MAVHFVGFRGNEYFSATRVWGLPDFIHRVHDRRMYREVDEHDTIVFGPKASPDLISRYNGDDYTE